MSTQSDSWLLAILGGANIGGAYHSAAENKEQAHKNRLHQIRMAKNLTQWRVEDLRKAGINPVLAAGTGLAASVPSAPAPAHVDNPFAGATALGAKMAATSVENKKADIQDKLAKSTASLQNAQAENATASASRENAQAENIRTMTPVQKELTQAKTNETVANTSLLGEQRSSIELQRQFNEEYFPLQLAQIDREISLLGYSKLQADEILKGLKVDNLLKKQRLTLEEGYFGLAKIAHDSQMLVSLADYERKMEEALLLAKKTLGEDVEIALKKYELGVKFSPETERIIRGFERVANILATGASAAEDLTGAWANVFGHKVKGDYTSNSNSVSKVVSDVVTRGVMEHYSKKIPRWMGKYSYGRAPSGFSNLGRFLKVFGR